VEVHALRRVGRVLEDAVLAATGSPSARLRGRDADDLHVDAVRTEDPPSVGQGGLSVRLLVSDHGGRFIVGTARKSRLIKQKSFAERLEDLMRRYTNQNLTAAQIIAELVALAKEVSVDASRGATFIPALNTDELAFYDAVAENESAVTEMGASVLADIARDLVRTLRRDVTTDWVARDDVRAKIRSTIKRLLAKYGYPPDAEADAIKRVLDQMETFADGWSPEA
jgi:Domain of unknown function (DUF3387)